MHSSRTKVVVAMSGGVDSSVAAALLREQGFEVVGCFMRLGGESERPATEAACATPTTTRPSTALPVRKQGCCSVNDADDARLVAAHLDIPFYAINFEQDFGRVKAYFAAEYHAGRTPNPCVRCNDWLKFGRLHDLAKQLGAEFVASGHYARIGRDPSGRRRLLRGLDAGKDQSYVLFGTTPERLDEMLLPIGELRKSEVRELARSRGLPVSEKPDSQEICFVPDGDYAGFVARQEGARVRPGRIVDEHGDELGEHPGHQHFTVGQRRGIPLALGRPVHVLSKDAVANTITVGPRDRLLRRRCIASQTNWLGSPSREPVRCEAKVRSTMAPVGASVRALESGAIEVRFDEPLEAVAPGQAVVCYEGDAVLCGGWIDRADETGDSVE